MLGWVLCATGVDVTTTGSARKSSRFRTHNRGKCAVRILRTALRRSLLPTVLVSFVLVTSVSTRIFQAFQCSEFEYDKAEGETRKYLEVDLFMSCDSQEYDATYATAQLMAILWPIGTPLLYAVLLRSSRSAIRARTPTTLSRATVFLWDDYTTDSFWWEPFEMCRKLALTGALAAQLLTLLSELARTHCSPGWVLMISEKYEQARVLVALLVSFCFLAAQRAIQPLKRCVAHGSKEDDRHHRIFIDLQLSVRKCSAEQRTARSTCCSRWH